MVPSKNQGYLIHFYRVLRHKYYVFKYLSRFVFILAWRCIIHDWTKFLPPEASGYANSPSQKDLSFGSKEYNDVKLLLKPVIDHHYSKSHHHPEHFLNGIAGMNMYDFVEMYCDWCAASHNNKGGSPKFSIEFCSQKYNLSDQMKFVMENTL